MWLEEFNNKYKYDFEIRDRKYLVGDIESSLNDKNEWCFELCVVFDGECLYEFLNINELVEWLLEEDSKIDLWFHNLDFDGLFFLKSEFMKTGTDIKLIQSGNMLLSFKIGNVTFKNSLALFPMSLKNLVRKFLAVNDENWEDDKGNGLELIGDDLVKYCSLDVLYLDMALSKFMKYFRDEFDIEISMTVPSTAMKVWRKFFNPDKEFINRNRRHNFFDEGYYLGGHTEKFINGRYIFRHVRYYDVNSLYPSVMRDLEFINSKLKRVKADLRVLKRLVKRGELFYCEVDLNINNEYLRFFPVYNEMTKSNDYPFGVHTIKMSEKGIDFVLKYGGWDNIINVRTILVGYDRKVIKPFERYVDVFYKARKSDPSNDLVYKLLLNGLYGKFGMKIDRETKVLNSTSEKMPKRIINNEVGVMSVFDEKLPFYQLDTVRYDIAGKVTETARLLMGDYINQIRLEFGDESVIYTDTDSIICQADLNSSDKLSCLLDNKELGKLSDEIGYEDAFICLGQKMYHFYKSGKKASKGVKNMDLDSFRGVIRGENEFVNKRFSRLGAFINKGFHGIMYVPYEIKNLRERLY